MYLLLLWQIFSSWEKRFISCCCGKYLVNGKRDLFAVVVANDLELEKEVLFAVVVENI